MVKNDKITRVNLANSHRGTRLALVVCVAATAFLLSACSVPNLFATDGRQVSPVTPKPNSGTPEAQDPFLEIDITRPADPPTDEWLNWTVGRDETYAEEVSGYLEKLGTMVGVEGFESPNDYYMEQGYGAVAPFGDYCIVVLNFDESYDGMSLAVLSRINFDASIIAKPTSDYESLKAFANYYRTWCAQGGDWPGTPPGTQSDVTVDKGEPSIGG
ncbi:hypothetical protein BGO17_02505 [Candidatus Saccharibacteria bacterium 49-20]|nr:MAG: hypothetical protein BGO17_02505 [Candidatus Saccharibacteria bacterium 49-20]